MLFKNFFLSMLDDAVFRHTLQITFCFFPVAWWIFLLAIKIPSHEAYTTGHYVLFRIVSPVELHN